MGLAWLVYRYSTINGQDKELRLEEIVAAENKLLRQFPDTDEYEMES